MIISIIRLCDVRLSSCVTAGYWYRDDSLALWDAIWTFVEQVLSLYYDEDVAVISDVELTAMLAELRQHSITALVRAGGVFRILSRGLTHPPP